MRKYKGTDLYLLPPAIFPSDPIDTMDARYLNYSNAPIVHPLQKALKIEVYNDMFFEKPPALHSDSTDKFSCNLDVIALDTHEIADKVSVTEIFNEIRTDLDKISPIEITTVHRKGCTHAKIMNSKHKLFFIKYTPEQTL